MKTLKYRHASEGNSVRFSTPRLLDAGRSDSYSALPYQREVERSCGCFGRCFGECTQLLPVVASEAAKPTDKQTDRSTYIRAASRPQIHTMAAHGNLRVDTQAGRQAGRRKGRLANRRTSERASQPASQPVGREAEDRNRKACRQTGLVR